MILTRRGKKLAAVVPIEDVKFLEELEDCVDVKEAERILSDQSEAPISYKKAETLRLEVGLPAGMERWLHVRDPNHPYVPGGLGGYWP
ncbi:MAG: hypothetical protein HY644_15470 [Acidobacteria bacterium]|nr:hypothetical protein [Acidobacteriota bacterium]